MVRLYLHIGMNKTGTSSIQRYLAHNDHRLLSAGWLYPRTGRSVDTHYGLSRALGFAHGRPAVDAAELSRLRAELDREVAESAAGALVLSSEDFVLRGDIAQVRDFLAGFDVRIVVYLRRHDHWWASVYNQAVKMVADPPWERGIQGYIRFARRRQGRQGRYRELLDNWASEFGVTSMRVRPFEAEQNPGGVVADFLRTIECPELAGAATAGAGRVNEALSAEALQLLEVVQRAAIPEELRRRLKERLLELPGDGSAGALLGPGLRRRLIEEQREDYEYIARTYLARRDGVLFREPEPLPRGAGERAPPPPLDAVAIVSRVIGLLDETR
jgi:hypothetical protein